LRLFARASLDQFAAIVMIVSAFAFTLQPTYFVTSQAAAQGGRIHSHSTWWGQQHSHVVTHVHADGTMHQHVVDDGTLDHHKKEPGYPNAAIAALLPALIVCAVSSIVQAKFTVKSAEPQHGTEPNGPTRPPRTPSIA
jgi:hypothetical protein